MQGTDKVMMVRPAAFGFNIETGKTNSFQQNTIADAATIQHRALAEFDNVVGTLARNGVTVYVFNDKPEPVKPDAIFPNNWIGFHPGGKVVLYPMMAKNRRYERTPPFVNDMEKLYSYHTTELIDFSHLEKDGIYLEGTGSVVFDHVNHDAYCALSPRSDIRALKLLCKSLGYEPVSFEAYDKQGKPIYHTNVMLSVGTHWVVVCLDSVKDTGKLLKHIIWSGKEIIKISMAQMEQFCGNILELKNADGQLLTVMSKTAYNAFTAEQLDVIAAHSRLIPMDIPTIEHYGGGSLRCMLAEVF